MITALAEPQQLDLFADLPAPAMDDGAVVNWPLASRRCPVQVGYHVRFPQCFVRTPEYAPWVARVFAVIEQGNGFYQVQAKLLGHPEKSIGNIFVDRDGSMPHHELSVLIVEAS